MSIHDYMYMYVKLTRVGLDAECFRCEGAAEGEPAEAAFFGRVSSGLAGLRCCLGALCSIRARTRFSASLFVRLSLCTDFLCDNNNKRALNVNSQALSATPFRLPARLRE